MTTVRGSIRNLAGWVALLAAPAALAAGAPQPADHWAMVDEYCVGCHNTTDWAGKLALDTLEHTPSAIPAGGEASLHGADGWLRALAGRHHRHGGCSR